MRQPTNEPFTPRLIQCLRNYSARKFWGDAVAGLTVGLVSLPLAMAFAISSGLSPQAGIYTAVIAGFLISVLGGSATQIGGPTGAFVVVVAGIVTKHGIDGLFLCTLMAGVLLMVLGLTGLGTAVKYIPRPVVIGFTNGIAVLIASTQLKDFFGLQMDSAPGEFIGRMGAAFSAWSTLSTAATALSAVSLLVLILFRRFVRRIPGSIVVLFGATAVAWGFHLPVETIESRFGGIPAGLPQFALPAFRFDLVLPLLSPALTVAMLGAIESLLSAVVADRMSGDKHNPNMELLAQGVANVASPLFGGLPATGAIARTATNIRSGARTPVAGIINALTLLAILLAAAPLAEHIPLPVLAAILMMVAWNMGEWSEIPGIFKLGKASIVVWLITFSLTVLADLTVAVETGMILAALLYIRQVTATSTVARVTPVYVEAGFAHSLQTNPLPQGVVAYRIHGPFLFGATDKLSVIDDEIDTLPPVVLLRLRNMTAIDATGLHALENLADRLLKSGRHLVLCGMRDQPARLMKQADFHQHIGGPNICVSLKAAVARAGEILAHLNTHSLEHAQK
ncbi:MAG TPA: solute carrier family 23 protein [Verrucomicrobiales bacterium]|jgi:SulP family sulfate permease|nr:solute carrier family 23 protein [Verrucomicrobiales bacterium]